MSLYLAERYVPQLQVEKSSGSLLGGFHLQQLAYQDKNLQLQLEHLIFEPKLRCAFTLQLCINELTLDGLVLNLSLEPSEAVTPAASRSLAPLPSAAAPVGLPFPASIARLQLNNIQLQLGENQISWQSFHTEFSGWGSRLQLDNSQLQQLKLQLAESEHTSDKEAFSYQAPEINLPAIPLTVMLNQLAISDIKVIQGDKLQQLEQLDFSLQLTPRELRVFDLLLRHQMAQLQGQATLQLSPDIPLTALFEAEMTDTELAGLLLKLQLDGSLRQLNLQLDSSQLIAAQLQGQLQLLSDNLPFEFNLSAAALQWPLQGKPELELQQSSLQVSGNLQQQGFELSSKLQMPSTPEIAINSRGLFTLASSTLDLQYYQLALLGGEISGKAQASVSANPSWQTNLSIKQLQPGLFWPDYEGRLSGQLQHQGALTADGQINLNFPVIALQGLLRDYPLELNGDLRLIADSAFNEFAMTTDRMQLQHGDNRVVLQGSLDQHWQITANLAIPELGHSLAGIAGQVNGTIALSGLQRQPFMDIQLQAQQLTMVDAALQQLDLSGQLSLTEQLEVNLVIDASGGEYQTYQLQQLTLALSGNEQTHQLSLALDSSEGQVELALDAGLRQREHWQAQIQRATITSVLGQWQLAEPFAINAILSTAELELATHCWLNAPTSLCFTEPALLSATTAAISLQLTQFELAMLEPFVPYQSQISGKMDATFNTRWQSGQLPQLRLAVNGSAGQLLYQLDAPVIVPWQQWQLNTELQDEHTRAKPSLEVPDPLLQSELIIDFNPQSQLKVTANIGQLLSDDRQLSAQLRLNQFTLDFLKPLIDEFSELQGELSSDIRLSGSLLNPMVEGEASLQGFRLKGKLAPADIDHADIFLRFKGEHAQLDGQLRTPEGELALTGSADWQDLNAWQASIRLTGDELRMQVPNAQLRVKPDLTINASPVLLSVSGSIHIPSADINIDSLPQNAVSLTSDLVLLDEELQPLSTEQVMAVPLQLDLRLHLGQRVRLSAFGLKTRLTGELRVQQQAQQSQPRVNGEVVLVDGTFRSYGQDLLIRHGKMTFSGPAEQPFLSVEAIRNPANMEDDVIAGIRVTGQADEPQIIIFSEPAKAQANALSYLLMGRDLDSRSGSAANAITTSLIGLSIAQSGKVLGEIGEAFGVRDLTLDTEGAGDASQVTVSGYLTRNLQLKYGIGIFEPIGQFTLRYRLLRSLYLEAVSGVDNAVDLLYKFEFD